MKTITDHQTPPPAKREKPLLHRATVDEVRLLIEIGRSLDEVWQVPEFLESDDDSD